MWSTLLVLHATAALLLIGALTHQTFAVLWRPSGKRNLVESFAAVRAGAYTNGVIVLFLITFVFGSVVYTNYRVNVRPVLEDLHQLPLVGLFELKEHFLAIALGLLPAYWYLWRRVPLENQKATRAMVTIVVMAIVWLGFVAGHVLNNARGLQ